MTSKNLFFRLMKEDLKRRLWTIALSLLVFFFSIPVPVAMVASDRNQEAKAAAASILNLLSGRGWVIFLVMVFSLVLGASGFSYLHSRQKVDFYHSLPVRREVLFLANYLNGILIFLVPYLANVVIGLGVAGVHGLATRELAQAACLAVAFHLAGFAMLYAVVVLAMMLTGSLVVGVLGAAVFNFYGPMLSLAFSGYCNAFFYTNYFGSNGPADFIANHASPFMYFTFSAVKGSWNTFLVGALVVFFLVTALSLLIYRHRKSEAAGKAMAFSISKPLIRIPLVVLFSLIGGLFFWSLKSSMGWAVFGLACGLVLSHGVIEVIYHFDFKKLFSHKIQLAACAVVALGIFCSFRYDLFRYDSYMPPASQVSWTAVSTNLETRWLDYVEVKEQGDRYRLYTINPDQYLFEHMRLSDNGPVYQMVEKAMEENSRRRAEGRRFRRDGRSLRFSVAYGMKEGRVVKRSYQVSLDSVMGPLEELYQDPVFENAIYPILSQTSEGVENIYVSQKKKAIALRPDKSDRIGDILKAYQQDLAAQTVAEKVKKSPIAYIQFATPQMVEHGIDGMQGSYPIYDSFARTKALLKEVGLLEP